MVWNLNMREQDRDRARGWLARQASMELEGSQNRFQRVNWLVPFVHDGTVIPVDNYDHMRQIIGDVCN